MTEITLDLFVILAHLMVACVFFVGVVSNFLPILPGPLIAWLGVVVYHFWPGTGSVGWGYLLIALGLVLAAQLADIVCTWWGARKFGASWKGALGALVGGLIGLLFFGPLGIILGPIFGAVVFEWINFRNHRDALRAGWGAFIGGLMALAVKLGLTFTIIAGFYLQVLA